MIVPTTSPDGSIVYIYVFLKLIFNCILVELLLTRGNCIIGCPTFIVVLNQTTIVPTFLLLSVSFNMIEYQYH